MNARRTLVAVLAGWSLTAAGADAQTTLRYRFKEGETLKYVRDQKMTMTRNVMGKDLETTVEQASDLTWTVRSVDAQGTAKIAIKFGRNKMTMNTPMGKIEVDSNSTEEPDDEAGKIFYKVIKGLSGLEVSGAISPTGEYSDIKVPEKALQDLQNIPGAENFGDMFTPDGLQRMLSQSGIVVPKEPVSKGTLWKGKSELKLPFGKMLVEAEYTYAGAVEKDGRSLEKITLKPKATIAPNPNAPFTIKLKSHEAAGTALFDNNAGRLLEVTERQTTEMDVESMGVAISQKMVQTMTMKLAK